MRHHFRTRKEVRWQRKRGLTASEQLVLQVVQKYQYFVFRHQKQARFLRRRTALGQRKAASRFPAKARQGNNYYGKKSLHFSRKVKSGQPKHLYNKPIIKRFNKSKQLTP